MRYLYFCVLDASISSVSPFPANSSSRAPSRQLSDSSFLLQPPPKKNTVSKDDKVGNLLERSLKVLTREERQATVHPVMDEDDLFGKLIATKSRRHLAGRCLSYS